MKEFAAIFSASVLLWLSGCRPEYPFYPVIGLKPVYLSQDSLSVIGNLPPQPINNTGPVFLMDTLFFMVEMRKGIHVINVGDSTNPVALTFIKIPAVTDFTLSGNTLYADNGTNLVTIDISNVYAIQVVYTQTDVFMPILFPNNYSGRFECVDSHKGIVIDWDTVTLKSRCTSSN